MMAPPDTSTFDDVEKLVAIALPLDKTSQLRPLAIGLGIQAFRRAIDDHRPS